MTRVLVVRCHPVDDSFTAAVDLLARRTLAAAGAEVRSIDLYAEGFVPELDAGELDVLLPDGSVPDTGSPDSLPHRDGRRPDLDPDLLAHLDHLEWCRALVLVYPTWWAGQPAMLKGWLDRTSALARRTGRRPRNIRRIVAVTTHGSSKFVNAAEGEGGKRTISRWVAREYGLRTRTRWIALYGIDTCDDATRERVLRRVERAMRRLA